MILERSRWTVTSFPFEKWANLCFLFTMFPVLEQPFQSFQGKTKKPKKFDILTSSGLFFCHYFQLNSEKLHFLHPPFLCSNLRQKPLRLIWFSLIFHFQLITNSTHEDLLSNLSLCFDDCFENQKRLLMTSTTWPHYSLLKHIRRLIETWKSDKFHHRMASFIICSV